MKISLLTLLTLGIWNLAVLADSPPASIPIVLSTDLDAGKTIQEPCPRSASTLPHRYMIQWNDTQGIDGSYIVVVHPTQIFLRSSHDNPNPDLVYWVVPLAGDQYAEIVQFLDGYQGTAFKNHREINAWLWEGYSCYQFQKPKISPWFEKFGEDRKEEWAQESAAAVNSNVRKILKELNRALAATTKKLPEDVSVGRHPKIARIQDPF